LQDFSFFELNLPPSSWYSTSAVELDTLLEGYFKSESVMARCKRQSCACYPNNIIQNRSSRTLYFPQKKRQFLLKLPKMLKMLFKKYTYSNHSGGSRLGTNILLPVLFRQKVFERFFFQNGKVGSLEQQQSELLHAVCMQNKMFKYYLFAYSVQNGTLDSGHYVTYALQYYLANGKLCYYHILLNDSNVSSPHLGGSAD